MELDTKLAMNRRVFLLLDSRSERFCLRVAALLLLSRCDDAVSA